MGTSKIRNIFNARNTSLVYHFSDWCHWWCLDLIGFTLSEANSLGHTEHCGLHSLPIIALVKPRAIFLSWLRLTNRDHANNVLHLEVCFILWMEI